MFSSPLSGTFFQFMMKIHSFMAWSFRPLSRGLFFNRLPMRCACLVACASFRPLSRGLFFNFKTEVVLAIDERCFRPLSRGLFFNPAPSTTVKTWLARFRPLSRGLFFNRMPAKPQPVCSRERIRGGDGGIASSGTLLRR